MASPMDDIVRAVASAESFLVCSHTSPDGDAVGSIAAMGHLLAALGKTFALFDASGLPAQFSWVNLPGPVLAELPRREFDWLVVLDCGDERRGGPELQAAMTVRPTMVIDHHVANPEWGALNWVEPSRSSTGEMVALLAKALGQPLAGPLGEAVYLSLVTDTGNFTYNNTSPQSLRLAAEIMELGLKPGRINPLIQNQWSLHRIQLFGEVLGDVTLHFDGQLGVIRITLEQLSRLGATAADCDGLINFALRIRGTRAAMLLREEPDGAVKVSLRSLDGANVQAVAAAFGGGGHTNAAGTMLQARMRDVEDKLIAAVGKALGPS